MRDLDNARTSESSPSRETNEHNRVESNCSPGMADLMACRILVVDDHPVMRRGLRTLLGSHPGWEIVAEAEDGVEAVEKALELKPDIVVLDITMPRMDGLEACRLIRRDLPKSEVVIVTQHDSPQMRQEALGAGARSYVVKSNMARDLPAAIESARKHMSSPATNPGSPSDS